METFFKKIVTLSADYATRDGKNTIEPLHIFLALLTAIFHRNKLKCSQRDDIAFSADDIATLEALAFMLDIKIQIDDEQSQVDALGKIDDHLPNFDSEIESIFTALNATMLYGENLLTISKGEMQSLPLSEASATVFSLVDIAKLSVWNYKDLEAMFWQCLLTAIIGSRDQKIDEVLEMTDAQFETIARTFLNDDCPDSDDILENGNAILQALVNHGHTDKLDGICRAFAPVSEHSLFANALVSCLKFGCYTGLPEPPLEHSLNRMYPLVLGLQADNHYGGINDALRKNVLQGSMNEAVTLVLKTVPLSDRNG